MRRAAPLRIFSRTGTWPCAIPKGRANYEPNSWGAAMGGPREDPERGFKSFADQSDGDKLRIRPESFADHYSQARQFYISQTPIEQKHVGDALVFELSKVERPDIRSRMVSHFRNIDEELAATVANGLGLEMPMPAQAARPTISDLPPSDALSIVKNGPQSFVGRKLGLLVTDGADADLVQALVTAVESANANYEIVAPKIGGATLSDGTRLEAQQKFDGGPSVLYDAIAIIASEEGAKMLAMDAAAKDFLTDAFAHCKFIGLSKETRPLLVKAGIADDLDDGCFALKAKTDAKAFITALAPLRFWAREPLVDLDALEA
jgi:catalase